MPIVAAGAILNGASYARQAPVAPGSFVTLFGSKLTQGTAQATTTPLPTQLAGANVIIGGREAPIFFASDGQVNAIVPYGLPVNTTHQVIVTKGATVSTPQSLTLAAAAPGIFARDGSGQGQGIVVDAAGKYVDASNPAAAGQVIVLYCTGLGEVTPSVATGAAASLTQLSRTTNPVSLTIGGVTAQVAFSGLAPGFVGLYQVNAVVPTGVVAGSQVPVVITSAGQSSAPVTIAIK